MLVELPTAVFNLHLEEYRLQIRCFFALAWCAGRDKGDQPCLFGIQTNDI